MANRYHEGQIFISGEDTLVVVRVDPDDPWLADLVDRGGALHRDQNRAQLMAAGKWREACPELFALKDRNGNETITRSNAPNMAGAIKDFSKHLRTLPGREEIALRIAGVETTSYCVTFTESGSPVEHVIWLTEVPPEQIAPEGS